MTLITALWQRSVAQTRRAESSKLLALGQLEFERYPSAAVAYALKSLELSDTLEARRFALEALQQGPTALFMGFPEGFEGRGWAQRVSFSPDGKWLAIGGFDSLHIQPRNGEEPLLVGRYPTVGGNVVQPAFSASGYRLGTVINDEVRIFSVPDFKEIGVGKNEEGPSLLFVTRDAFYTATAVGDGEVLRSWSLEGTESQILGRMEPLLEGDIDRAARWLAYASARRVFLRTLSPWGEHGRLIAGHPAEVYHVVFDPEGTLLATSDASSEIRLWSLDSESKEPVRILEYSRQAGSSPGGGLRGLVFDDSGEHLAAFGHPDYHPTVRLWNLRGPVDAEAVALKREDFPFLNMHAAFDPSGRWLATAHTQSVALWPVGGPLPVTFTSHEGYVESVAFAPDGKHLVSASIDGTVRVWPLESGDPSRVILEEDVNFPILAMDPAGKFVVVSGRSSVFVVPLEGGTYRKLEGFSSGATLLRVALDSEGRLVAAAPNQGPVSDKVIRIWDLESGDSWTLGPLETAGDGSQGGFFSLSFLPNGRFLSDGSDGLHLWSLKEGLLKTLSREASGYAAVSRDGRFALRTENAGLRWLDLEKGVSKILTSHGTSYPVAFDPSGKLAISGSYGIVRVGPVTGEEPHLLFARMGDVRAVAASPDGRWIASSGMDGKIRLWPMPDMNEPPFHTLPYQELLDRLRNVTSVRVVGDEASPTGYRIDYAPFPGWEEVPVR